MRQQDVVNAAIEITNALGMAKDDTLFSHSVCPDEINHEENDITNRLRIHFNGVFSLGGLAGIPFSGKTGFAAYAAHVPDNGNIFVLFAPHCAVSTEGRCGFYHRQGQAKLTPACGAALGAVKAIKDATNPPPLDIMSKDMQMDYIKRVMYDSRQRITTAKSPNAEATYCMYEHISAYISEIVEEKYVGSGKIAILGGIQINVANADDYFEPLTFVVLDKDGQTDHLAKLRSMDSIV